MVGDRQDQQVGDAARPRREERHRSAERSAGARAVHRVEAREDAREVVRGRNDLGRHRPGPGVGDAGLDGGLHGDARQRRHARHAASAQGRRRWQRVEAGAAAAAAVARSTSIRRSCRRFATACGWWSTAPARAAARASPGTTSPARPARRRSSRIEGATRPRADGQGPARQRLVRVLRAARQPADRRRRVPRARHSRRQRRADRAPRPRHLLREAGRPAAAAAAEPGSAPGLHGSVRARRRPPVGGQTRPCSNDDSTTTSTGRSSPRCSRCARSASR